MVMMMMVMMMVMMIVPHVVLALVGIALLPMVLITVGSQLLIHVK